MTIRRNNAPKIINILIIQFVISLLFLAPPAAAAPPSVETGHSRATLVWEKDGLEAGKPLRAGLLLEHEPGWHSYWENPGDSGLATQLDWQLPDGFSASGIDWPAPAKKQEGTLATYGYSGRIFLPVTIMPPANLSQDSYVFKLSASWLACNDICIPETAGFEVSLPVAANANPTPEAALFAGHDAARPASWPDALGYRIDGKKLILSLPRDLNVQGPGAYFFLRQPNVLAHSETQALQTAANGIELEIPLAANLPPERFSGILSWLENGMPRYAELAFSEAAPPAAQPALQTGGSLLALILFAFLGGLILNLMPCVLPVLSLKAIAIARKAGKERAETLRHGIAYTLGISICFLAIAILLIGLKQGGQALGWGFQMQSPAFVGFLIYLLFLIGLNLSGYFELPTLFGQIGHGLANEQSPRGSFFTGLLATLVATPCTAPFMASAVGAALALPAWQALLVFESLALGLALPFLLVSLFPACLRWLPKPGAWMDIFRQFLAFPMYASVIWLLWVLATQTGPNGVLIALAGLLLIVIALWMRRIFLTARGYRIAALLLFAFVIGWSLPALQRMAGQSTGMAKQEGAVAFSEDKIVELRAAGKAVFVDATAAWCITCQVNGRLIHSEAMQEWMKQRNITLMIADWTLQDAAISRWLKNFGYEGVPLYVYYPPHGEPVVLPQLLTETIMKDALK